MTLVVQPGRCSESKKRPEREVRENDEDQLCRESAEFVSHKSDCFLLLLPVRLKGSCNPEWAGPSNVPVHPSQKSGIQFERRTE